MHPSTSRVKGCTASTVCTKNPRPRTLPICPTPLILRRWDRSMSVRILHQQNHRRGKGVLPGLLQVRLHQRRKGDIWLIEQTIQRFGLFPTVHLSRQRTQGVLRQVGGRLYCSSRSTHIVQLDTSKGSLGPALGIQQWLVCSSCSVSLCKMWVRIGPSRGWDESDPARAPSHTVYVRSSAKKKNKNI